MLFWVIIILAYCVGVFFVLALCNAAKRGPADLPGLPSEVPFESFEQELRATDETNTTEDSETQEEVAQPVA